MLAMNPPLIIAAAQTLAVAGDIAANAERHLDFIQAAASHEVQLLLFPELSLTGYEPTLARQAAITVDDERLLPLREAAVEHSMTVIVGAPLLLDGELKIGALALLPDGSLATYAKQYLHSGEDEVFTPGCHGVCVTVGETRAALAVCADITHAEHAQQAAVLGAQLYAAGMLLSERGYPAETAMLQGYAREHRMAVLLANYGGPTGGWQPAGRSAVWDEQGELVVAAPGLGEQLVIASKLSAGWQGRLAEV
jgi:predicted amidohydrolase